MLERPIAERCLSAGGRTGSLIGLEGANVAQTSAYYGQPEADHSSKHNSSTIERAKK